MTSIGQVRTGPIGGGDPHETSAASAATAAAAPIALSSSTFKGNAGLAGVAAGTATIGFGARGDGAKAIQTALGKLGLLQGAADGVFGRMSQNAVAAFQRGAGLDPTGVVDQTTLAAIDKKLGPALSPGMILAEAGRKSIETKMTAHRTSIDKTGIGTMFGDHGSFKRMSASERETWIRENQKPGSVPPTPKESSCIGWAMENVKAAYTAAGKGVRWAEIERIVVSKGSKGTDLAKELQKDGWEGVYFNPDAKRPSDGNPEHSFSASQVAKGKGYYGINVKHTVQNYRPSTAEEGKTPTAQDLKGFKDLEKVPFFFGLARGGTHTFVGTAGKVNEFHWDRMPDDKGSIEERPLTEFPWNSGVVMVPPGTWPVAGTR